MLVAKDGAKLVWSTRITTVPDWVVVHTKPGINIFEAVSISVTPEVRKDHMDDLEENLHVQLCDN